MAKIDDYKDRMTAPIGGTRIDPKTRKPLPPLKAQPAKKSVKRK